MGKPSMEDIKEDFGDLIANRNKSSSGEKVKVSQTTKQPSEEPAANKVARKKTGVQMTPAAHKMLKTICVETDVKEYEGLAEALNDWFVKKGKEPVA